ncbi:MAG: mechanosensitive ion channel [Planctomycetes bacterium]|nr:mechanosensitive ion channel [Planctomycetota bacterium]
MMRRVSVWTGGVGAAMILAVVASAVAQVSQPASGPTLDDLKKYLKHAESETELEPTLKQEVIERYQAAIERREIAGEAADATKSFLQRINSAPEELRLVRQNLASPPQPLSVAVSAQDDLDSLQQKLETLQKIIADPEKGLAAQEEVARKELAARKTRLETITANLAEIEQRLAMIQADIDAPTPDKEPRELTMARQVLLTVRRMRAVEERMALTAEQNWCHSESVTDLLKARIELVSRDHAQAKQARQALQDAVDTLRGNAADKEVRKAEQIVAKASDHVKPVAAKNLELARESHDLTSELSETTQRATEAEAKLKTLKSEFEQSRKMVDGVGLTESIGLLLRQQRARLSDTRGLHSRLALRGESVRKTRMRLFQIETEIAALQDLDAAAASSAAELQSDDGITAASINNTRNQGITDEIKPLLQQRLDLLDRLNQDHQSQFEKLVQLDNHERKLLDATAQYAAFIDERVLWIRTGTLFGGSQASRGMGGTGWLVDRMNWMKVVDAIQVNFHRDPLPYGLAGAALLCWIGLRLPCYRRLRSVGQIAADDACHAFSPTGQALFLSLLLSAFLPGVLWFVGWRLDHCASTSRFVHAVAVGLLRAAVFAVPLELLRWTVVRGGLAELHFGWRPETSHRFRRHLFWFIPVGVLLIGIVGMVETTADEQRMDALGRLAYLTFAGFLTLFCYCALPNLRELTVPYNSSTADDRRRDVAVNDDAWVNRLARVCVFLAVIMPIGLLVLCWTGYFYTALQLTWRMQSSAWLAMGLVLLRGSIERWITLERRRMAVLQAEEIRVIEGAGQHPQTDGQSPFLFPRWNWPDFRLNLTQIVNQVTNLLDTGLMMLMFLGLWFVWADVTPALHILDRVTLWNTTVEEIVSIKGADDQPAVQVVQRPRAITVANLGLAILIISMAMIAARNIPGLVEVILLEHLSVDAGIRFAATGLVRYVIFVAGIVLAFGQVGIGWNSVQWLVAAASVGLGFGLQEIFANFVSGIILLFERPMRVGDVITIGSTTGTVSRIRFRATTIVDGDRKELIVPNKAFITGNLLNWTLSDSINRVAVKVGVAYGSDPNKVRELLLKIAGEHSSLLKDPTPTAVLEELGDSSLVFTLRAFLPNLKDRQRATHELNSMIHDRFKAAGIEIPFPQHEVSVNFKNSMRAAA